MVWPWGIPRDAAAAELAGDLMLQGPLAQVHHIGSLVDPHNSIRRAGGQHQAHVFRGKLHISHWGSTVHQGGSLYLKTEPQESVSERRPSMGTCTVSSGTRISEWMSEGWQTCTDPVAESSLLVIGLPYNLFPYSGGPVEWAGGQNLPELWVSPGHPPHRATVGLHTWQKSCGEISNAKEQVYQRRFQLESMRVTATCGLPSSWLYSATLHSRFYPTPERNKQGQQFKLGQGSLTYEMLHFWPPKTY